MLTVGIGDEAFEVVKQETVQSVRDTIERRIDAFGLTEPSIRIQGEDRILIEVPGVSNIDEYLEKLELSIHIVSQAGATRNPNETLFMLLPDSQRVLAPGEQPVQYLIERQECVNGSDIQGTGVDAERGIAVTFTLNSRGTKDFANCTRNNIGERLAIVLDGEVISAPNVNEAINTGAVQITGGFEFNEAKTLATLLGTGSLAAEVESIEERVVGPGLGAESIRSGAIACLCHGSGAGVHGLFLWSVRDDGERGAGGDPRVAAWAAVAVRCDPDPARDRRDRADRRHGGRRQRAGVRACP